MLFITVIYRVDQSMAEGNIGTHSSQLTESLEAIRQVQDSYKKTHDSLHQVVVG